MSGYTIAEAFSGVGWTRIIHPDDAAVSAARLNRLMALKEDVSDLRIITKTGDIRWLRMHGLPVQEDGFVRVFAAARDVTTEKQAELALHESRQSLRLVARHMSLTVWTTDADLRIRFCSGAQNQHTLPLMSESDLGRRLDEIAAFGRSPDAVITAHQRALREEFSSVLWEYQGHSYRILVEPLYSPQGVAIGCLAMALVQISASPLA